MKLELGKIKIDDIQFAEKTYVKDHVLYVNKEEVEALRKAVNFGLGELEDLES